MKKPKSRKREILEHGQEIVWIKGGRGGLGNAQFATPTNQAPEHAQPGEPGRGGLESAGVKSTGRCWISLAFPNAGKSTLLSVITQPNPRSPIMHSPPSRPNLGIVAYRDGKSFCVADLPGIIEGAAEGPWTGPPVPASY